MSHTFFFQYNNDKNVISYTTVTTGKPEVQMTLNDANYALLQQNYLAKVDLETPSLIFTKPNRKDVQDLKTALEALVKSGSVTALDVAKLLLKIIP